MMDPDAVRICTNGTFTKAAQVNPEFDMGTAMGFEPGTVTAGKPTETEPDADGVRRITYPFTHHPRDAQPFEFSISKDTPREVERMDAQNDRRAIAAEDRRRAEDLETDESRPDQDADDSVPPMIRFKEEEDEGQEAKHYEDLDRGYTQDR